MDRDVRLRRAPRAIDQDRRAGHGAAGRPYGGDGLLNGSARGHDVVDDEHPVARRERETTTELATGLALAPLRVDRAHAELPRDFMGEDDPAGRRTSDGVDAERSRPECDRGAQALGVRGTLKDPELLQVQRRVAARGEDEVPLPQRIGLTEDALDAGRRDGHRDYSARMRALTVIPRRAGSGAVRDVPDPTARDGEVLVDVVRVGLDGTDAEIERGEFGEAPPGSDVLVIGHESFGRVAKGTSELPVGTPVVASVRRPDGCPNCARGEQDMCLWGNYSERGILRLHGYCAERYAERPEYLFRVPNEILDVAVLLEPLTIGEKGWRHAFAAQRRMSVWEPKRALVTGAGAVGILAALALRLRGLDVTVVERTDKPERRALLERIGVQYGATSVTPLRDLAGPGRIDVLLDATGSARVAFEAIRLVGTNGVVILTSVTGAGGSLEVPADEINRRLVLNNALVIGTVNANAVDFRQGLADLAEAERRWPGFLLSLITRRVPLERAAGAVRHDPAQIKQVVEVR